ncbi:MAG TPA: flagellar hook-basal body protein [Desulfotomaculum sp.]|nr:flagellar hook-basal body protein [Desulfotomaculum sp.]
MLRGIYTAASGLNLQQTKIDVVANNIANVSTAGFKRDRIGIGSFPEILLLRMEAGKRPEHIGVTCYGSLAQDVSTDFRDGPLQNTGVLRDVALMGEGFLAVETADGERYWRGGTLFVDGDGFLVTASGDRVLGENGPIAPESSDFRIAEDGTITVAGNPVDRLLLVDFEDKRALVKEGRGYFRYDGPWPVTASAAVVRQGFLEGSNVELAEEMARLIEGLRAYQLSQRSVRTHDELLGRTVNQVGKVR